MDLLYLFMYLAKYNSLPYPLFGYTFMFGAIYLLIYLLIFIINYSIFYSLFIIYEIR